MSSQRRRLAAVTAAAALTPGFAGCGSNGGGGGGPRTIPRSGPMPSRAAPCTRWSRRSPSPSTRSGPTRPRHLQPQPRLPQAGVFPAGATDTTEGSTPIPDLATDTGQSNEDATQWSFTLKDGPKWQDGKPVTCEDVKYGASRNFAPTDHRWPELLPPGYLDVPQDAERTPG